MRDGVSSCLHPQEEVCKQICCQTTETFTRGCPLGQKIPPKLAPRWTDSKGTGMPWGQRQQGGVTSDRAAKRETLGGWEAKMGLHRGSSGSWEAGGGNHSRHTCGSSCPRKSSRRSGAWARCTAPRVERRCWTVPRPGTLRTARWPCGLPPRSPSPPQPGFRSARGRVESAHRALRLASWRIPCRSSAWGVLPGSGANCASTARLRCNTKAAPPGARRPGATWVPQVAFFFFFFFLAGVAVAFVSCW